LGVAWAKRSAARHINLYVTNVPGPTSTLYLAAARLLQAVPLAPLVPGPTSTLYLAAARLLQAVPLAPLVAGVRLSVTALSYDGQFAVSLLADDNMLDLSVLADSVRTAFEDYIQAGQQAT
jgi:diacylglycerol O-acyltransferase / wax synthase